jgi:hypothetical protein
MTARAVDAEQGRLLDQDRFDLDSEPSQPVLSPDLPESKSGRSFN